MNSNAAESQPPPPPEDPAEAKTDEINWERQFLRRWSALGREILGRGPGVRRVIKELMDDCRTLVAMTAVFEADGNLTLAAERWGSSRRSLRDSAALWARSNPSLLPEGFGKRRKRSALVNATPEASTATESLVELLDLGSSKGRRGKRRTKRRRVVVVGKPAVEGQPVRGEQGGAT